MDKKEWYDESVKLVEENVDYFTYEYSCKGKGVFTTYRVFDGIEIVFMDFDTKDSFLPVVPHEDIIEVTWCCKGRLECEFSNNTVSHLQAGDFGIDGSNFLPVSYGFPLGIFEAITLIINKREFSKKTKDIICSFSIDLEKLCDTLELDKSWYICRANKQLQHLFDEIYHAKGIENKSYFSIKALELLYHVQYLTKINECEVKYYTKDKIERVKKIKDYLLSDFESKKNIEQCALKFGLGITMFRSIFIQIYGDTPKVYERKYKMAIAGRLLNDKNMNIATIAIKLGYNNPSKFAAAFKEFYGVLPKDYRKTI